MQHKDTSQQAFLIIYLMYFIIYLLGRSLSFLPDLD